jgi:hypothetical protein
MRSRTVYAATGYLILTSSYYVSQPHVNQAEMWGKEKHHGIYRQQLKERSGLMRDNAQYYGPQGGHGPHGAQYGAPLYHGNGNGYGHGHGHQSHGLVLSPLIMSMD